MRILDRSALVAAAAECLSATIKGRKPMKPVSYAALAFALALATPAVAADLSYKVVDKFKMPDGGWDYATTDLQKNLIYWVRNDHTDVIDAKTNKMTQLKSTGNGH